MSVVQKALGPSFSPAATLDASQSTGNKVSPGYNLWRVSAQCATHRPPINVCVCVCVCMGVWPSQPFYLFRGCFTAVVVALVKVVSVYCCWWCPYQTAAKANRIAVVALHSSTPQGMFSKALPRMEKFNRWLFAQDEEAIVVSAGHSLWFMNYMRTFLPRDSAHDAKSKKVVNCGAIAFDVVQGKVRVLYGVFALLPQRVAM